MKRDPGYYWIKFDAEDAWEIGRFIEKNKWALTGHRGTWRESDFYAIGEIRLIHPNESPF